MDTVFTRLNTADGGKKMPINVIQNPIKITRRLFEDCKKIKLHTTW